jgi:hypothetical protein
MTALAVLSGKALVEQPPIVVFAQSIAISPDASKAAEQARRVQKPIFAGASCLWSNP